MLAFAAPPMASAIAPGSILVVVNLSGGCSHNISPIYHGAYRTRNPTISFSEADSLPISNEQGLHPSLTSFKQAWDEGKLALVNLVGYPNPNRSHAESANIWFQGMRNASPAIGGGWGARLTCQLAHTFGGISLSGQNLFSQGDCFPPRALGNLQNFGESNLGVGVGDEADWLRLARDEAIAKSTLRANGAAKFVSGNMMGLQESLARVRTQLVAATHPTIAAATFGNSGFGNQCRDAARMVLSSSLGTRLMFLEHGGFDTHSGERQSLTNNLTNINAGLDGLMKVAKDSGNWDRLIIITMSEFCRTFETDSQGTDHGHAGPLFVMGGGVVGGIKSPTPTEAETSGHYYNAYHVHFCEPFYQAVQGMGLNADLVFPESFDRKYFSLFA